MSQLDLLDARPACAGMARAASHADPSDLASVRLYAEQLAHTHIPFTAEDVRAKLSDAQNARLDCFPCSLGGVFHQLRKDGTLEPAGWATAQRPEARGRGTRLWRGTTSHSPLAQQEPPTP